MAIGMNDSGDANGNADVPGAGLPTPAEHFGFELGADRRLADWEEIAGYFWRLDAASDRVRTLEIGKSTEGNPFLMAIISSPDNIANLDAHRETQRRLADPRLVSDGGEAARLMARAKAVVAVGCSIHATEAGATQMSPLLAHRLAAGNDDDALRILDDAILLLLPSLNPDGLGKVKAWYEASLGKKYEGIMPPFLYQKYTGHDNNRDWFMFTQRETRLVLERCLNAWHPHILLDMHQTRPNGSRMILPPFVDPTGPNVDPIITAQIAMLGTAMAADMAAEGKAGVAVNAVYDAYSPNRTYQHYHAGVRLLSEAAGARIATPVKLRAQDLRSDRGETPALATWNHPLPWEGGEWRLRDIVDYDLSAAMSCLWHAARLRQTLVGNFYRVGKNALADADPPYAFVVPTAQHDAYAAAELLGTLRAGLVEVHEAAAPFSADGQRFAAGSRVILRGQPYWAYAKTLMEQSQYPDLRVGEGGPPKQPYDVTAHCLPLQMGVNAYAVKSRFAADLRLLGDDEARSAAFAARPELRGRGAKTGVAPHFKANAGAGQVNPADLDAAAYVVPTESNASARLVNRLLDAGVEISRASRAFTAGGASYGAGAFAARGGAALRDAIAGMGGASNASREDAMLLNALGAMPDGAGLRRLRMPCVGVYKSHIPAVDEGWTRFVLEEYGFRYESLSDADIRAGGLHERFDAIALPHQRPAHMSKGHGDYYHPAYIGGLGDEGAAELRRFAELGGALVTWDGSARYAMRHLGLKVRNVVADMKRADFYAPGSLLAVLLDTNHPIAYGMPSLTAVMFYDSPAFDIREGRVVGKYPLRNPLFSGLLIGPEKLYGRTALALIPVGKGEVTLMGFRPHFRAQARGTYKLLFNALYAAAWDRGGDGSDGAG